MCAIKRYVYGIFIVLVQLKRITGEMVVTYFKVLSHKKISITSLRIAGDLSEI